MNSLKIIQIAKQVLSEQEPAVNPDLKGFVTNIEDDTVKNKNFRKVLYTGEHSQLVLMSIKPKEDIGEEVHDVDQFFRIDEGSGKVVINGITHKISNGFAIVVPAGARHNVINDGKTDLKLYSLYSPPHHRDKVVHRTKRDAIKDKLDIYADDTTE
jgi:mannose-6-phosphate isomerase-like protein (cupin superfamily)